MKDPHRENAAGRMRRQAAWKRSCRLTALVGLGAHWYRVVRLLASGSYGVDTLPLHLCSLAVYLCVIHAFFSGEVLGQLLYALCLPAAVLALLFPAWERRGYITVCAYLVHLSVSGYILLSVGAGFLRPRPKMAPICLLILMLLAVPVWQLNVRLGTNYLFLMQPAPNSPMTWLAASGRFGHLVPVIPILFLCWLLMYLPYIRLHKKEAD